MNAKGSYVYRDGNMNGFQIEDIDNESDVEQKFILPFLTESPPFGLGYDASDFKTKSEIRSFEIEKGTSKKLYFPDYIIVLHGLPVLVIEAKHPNDTTLPEALREARLYATQLNQYSHRVSIPAQEY